MFGNKILVFVKIWALPPMSVSVGEAEVLSEPDVTKNNCE